MQRAGTIAFVGKDGTNYEVPELTPLQEDRRRAFIGAIVNGRRPGGFKFEDLAKEFANERFVVYTMLVRTGVPLNNVGDKHDVFRECGNTIHTQGVGAVLHNRIIQKGFLPPTECQDVGGYDLTPLMIAKLLGREWAVKVLLANGAEKDDTETIVYYRKGRVLGGPKERMAVPWTYMDFSAPPKVGEQKGGRRRHTGRVRRRKQQTRRARRTAMRSLST